MLKAQNGTLQFLHGHWFSNSTGISLVTHTKERPGKRKLALAVRVAITSPPPPPFIPFYYVAISEFEILRLPQLIVKRVVEQFTAETSSTLEHTGERTGFHSAGTDFGKFSQTVAAEMERGVPMADAKRAALAEVRGNFSGFLSARISTQPFCYCWGPTNTHGGKVAGVQVYMVVCL